MMHLTSSVLALGLLSATTIINAKTIPKTIIQTSKSSTIDRLDWIEYRNSLQATNPDFEMVHYSDDEARSFIATHYGDTILQEAYDMVTPIMRADLFRLAAVYKLGGFYFDMDMLGKESLNPMVDAINNEEYQAVFPKEWWVSSEFYGNIFPGRSPEDPEDHWQMGQYAFAAVPEHPFIKDALEEATVRSINLMKRKPDPDTIRDVDILATTGPYLFTELYHTGRKEGKYTDVLHIQGDSSDPVLEHRHGGPDWHKFGKYCEHMLSHTWTKPERRGLQEYVVDEEYGAITDEGEVIVDIEDDETTPSPTVTPEGGDPEGVDRSSARTFYVVNSCYLISTTLVAVVVGLLAFV